MIIVSDPGGECEKKMQGGRNWGAVVPSRWLSASLRGFGEVKVKDIVARIEPIRSL